jgi:Tetratricopeptide repeat
MKRLLASILITLATPAAFAQAEAFRHDALKAIKPGTVLHYTKSNRDGSEPWHFDVYYQSPTRINVIKWFAGANDFVEVMADIDPARAMPVAMQQWNTASARREPRMSVRAEFDADGTHLHAQLVDGPQFKLSSDIGPLHFWGFDLAGLGFMLPHLAEPTKSFGIAFADPNRPGKDGAPVLVGRATFEYQGEETIDGAVTRKYKLSGPVLADQVGAIWVNRDNGLLERAEHPIPTSTDWTDWKLELESVETMDGSAWERFKLELADAQRAQRPAASAAAAMKKAFDEGGVDAAFAAAADFRKAFEASLEGDFNTLGYTVLGAKRFDDAVRIFERVVHDYPKSANAWDSLGEAQAEAGRAREAIASYRRALKLDPNNEHAREAINNLAQ